MEKSGHTVAQPAESEVFEVVLLGSFNPRIFHPSWLATHNLVTPEELNLGTRNSPENLSPIVTPEFANLRIGSEPDTIRLECLSDRLICGTTSAAGETRNWNTVTGILALLPHTPIKAVGINHRAVVDAKTEEKWHQMGNILVPKERIWSRCLERPGMLLVQVQGQRSGEFAGPNNVTVRPLESAEHGRMWRVEVSSNIHYNIPESPQINSLPESPAVHALRFIDARKDDAKNLTTAAISAIFAALLDSND